MPKITNLVRYDWDWEKEGIAKAFGFFSYNTGKPHWRQVNMYVVDVLMQEMGALNWKTDGTTFLSAVFELDPHHAKSFGEMLTAELRDGNISRFRNHAFWYMWKKHRRSKRANSKSFHIKRGLPVLYRQREAISYDAS